MDELPQSTLQIPEDSSNVNKYRIRNRRRSSASSQQLGGSPSSAMSGAGSVKSGYNVRMLKKEWRLKRNKQVEQRKSEKELVLKDIRARKEQ